MLFINIVKLVKSFGFAFKGIATLIVDQQNARVHMLAAVVVVAAGLYFNITTTEWCMAVLSIGLVFGAEGLNTALEYLADSVHPEQHPLVGKAKDIAAGGVLIAAICAAAVGVLIFGKYIAALF